MNAEQCALTLINGNRTHARKAVRAAKDPAAYILDVAVALHDSNHRGLMIDVIADLQSLLSV